MTDPVTKYRWLLQEVEAAEAHAEMERRMRESIEKEEESHRLADELRRTQAEMEEKQRALQEALSTPRALHVSEQEEDDDDANSHSKKFCQFSVYFPINERIMRVNNSVPDFMFK